MKPLIKIMAILALFFASTFIILQSTGLITVDRIEQWLAAAKNVNAFYIALTITGLLFADLFIAVPTLTVMILGGYFLGAVWGSLAAICGLFLAGCCGYAISRKYGHLLLEFLLKDQQQRAAAVGLFREHGAVVILLSRATPILPEVSACMAGLTHMNFYKFLVLWSISTIPYAIIAAAAGAVSTVQNPKPAILAAVGLTGFFWLGWALFRRYKKSTNKAPV